MSIQQYDAWHTPATDYLRTRVGAFRIASYRYSMGYYNMSGLKDSALFVARKPLTITNLQERVGSRWQTCMVDDPPHWEAMKFYAEKASGRVLSTGLGLGLVNHALATNPKVSSVTVVERSTDVIGLVGPLIPACNIVQDDFYSFLATTNQEFDTCIVDLWVAHDVASKMKAYYEAIQTSVMVKERWPQAILFFHGFTTLCDAVWPISEDTRRALNILGEEREA